MIDFTSLDESGSGSASNPYAGKNSDGEWIAGEISIDWLTDHFGQCSTAQEMIDATESEGLKLYFAWIKDHGMID